MAGDDSCVRSIELCVGSICQKWLREYRDRRNDTLTFILVHLLLSFPAPPLWSSNKRELELEFDEFACTGAKCKGDLRELCLTLSLLWVLGDLLDGDNSLLLRVGVRRRFFLAKGDSFIDLGDVVHAAPC